MKSLFLMFVLVFPLHVSAVTDDDISAATGILQSMDVVAATRSLLPTEITLIEQIKLAIKNWDASRPPPLPIPSDLTPELQITLESITP